jgi:hypothetical protein
LPTYPTLIRHSPFDSRRRARSSPGCTVPEAFPAAGDNTTPATPHLNSDAQTHSTVRAHGTLTTQTLTPYRRTPAHPHHHTTTHPHAPRGAHSTPHKCTHHPHTHTHTECEHTDTPGASADRTHLLLLFHRMAYHHRPHTNPTSHPPIHAYTPRYSPCRLTHTTTPHPYGLQHALPTYPIPHVGTYPSTADATPAPLLAAQDHPGSSCCRPQHHITTPHLISDAQHRTSPRQAHCSHPDAPQTNTQADPHHHTGAHLLSQAPHTPIYTATHRRHTPTGPPRCTLPSHAHIECVNTHRHPRTPYATTYPCACFPTAGLPPSSTQGPTHLTPRSHKCTCPATPPVASHTPSSHTRTDCNTPSTSQTPHVGTHPSTAVATPAPLLPAQDQRPLILQRAIPHLPHDTSRQTHSTVRTHGPLTVHNQTPHRRTPASHQHTPTPIITLTSTQSLPQTDCGGA